MSEKEKDFLILAVKLLFERIKEGKIKFVAESVPQTLQALDAVRFDEAENPIYETITPPVRALANLVFTQEVERLEKEAEEQERNSPVHEHLSAPTEITEEILRTCTDQGSFTALALELYKETGFVLAICSHVFMAQSAEEGALTRNQAICAGLLVRITKFMIAVSQLSTSGKRGEVILALNRSILESATNLRFLLLKNEQKFYDRFVYFSLGPERELYDLIQSNIAKRDGRTILPIEQRMLNSIERVCRLAGVKIEDVDPNYREWAGGLRNRLRELGEEAYYVALQRVSSHAVHGTWVDLVLYHIKEKESGFVPDPTSSNSDPRLLCPICRLVLRAGRSYLESFFGDIRELRPLYRRIDDLQERIHKVDEVHEQWLSKR